MSVDDRAGDAAWLRQAGDLRAPRWLLLCAGVSVVGKRCCGGPGAVSGERRAGTSALAFRRGVVAAVMLLAAGAVVVAVAVAAAAAAAAAAAFLSVLQPRTRASAPRVLLAAFCERDRHVSV